MGPKLPKLLKFSPHDRHTFKNFASLFYTDDFANLVHPTPDLDRMSL